MLDSSLVLPNLVGVNAVARPDDLALVEAGGPALTWREYHEANHRWAGVFRSVGVGAADHVVTMIPNSPLGVQVWLGLSMLGAVDVPLNPVFPLVMATGLVGRSNAKVLVVSDTYLDDRVIALAALPQFESVIVIGDAAPLAALGKPVAVADALLARAQAPDDLVPPQYWDVASVVFTSGTTSGSKGVMLPWGHLYASCEPWMWAQRGRGHYSAFPLFHYGGRLQVYVAALAGSLLVTRPQFSTSDFWSDVRRHDVASAHMIGAWANFLLAEPEREDDAQVPLEMVSMGPVIQDHEPFSTRFGVRIVGGFGSTEIGTTFTTEGCGDKITSNGKPVATFSGAEYRLVDDHDRPVARGEVGELTTRSSEPWTCMLGYLGDPAATVTAWRNGWFHTGDSFVQDEDGVFSFVDRSKDVIRRRGENISSMELEARILEHPHVAETAAIGVSSPLGEQDVMVFVVARPASGLTPEALFDSLEAQLPKFMCPRYIELVDELPKTAATMRVRKVELRARGLTASTWDREVHRPSRPSPTEHQSP